MKHKWYSWLKQTDRFGEDLAFVVWIYYDVVFLRELWILRGACENYALIPLEETRNCFISDWHLSIVANKCDMNPEMTLLWKSVDQITKNLGNSLNTVSGKSYVFYCGNERTVRRSALEVHVHRSDSPSPKRLS